MGRILIATLVGGLAVLLWGILAHTVLPLGEVGVLPLPAEESIVGPLQTALTEPGVYFFPAMPMDRELTALRYWTRVLFLVLIGVFSWVVISVLYWNWYRFPGDFTLAAGLNQLLAWFVAGLVIAAIVKPKAVSTTAAG